MTQSIAIFIFICFALCGFVHGTDPAQEIFDKVGDAVDIQALNKTAFEQVAELNNKLKTKCENNGHPEAYDKIMLAKDEVVNCIKNLVNVTELQDEIEKAKPTGDLDIVFGKYCRKKSTLKKCMTTFTSVVEPCLSPQEINTTKIIQNVTDSLLNFICHKEGDRIALFIAAGGPECFQSKQAAVQDCLNETYGGYIPAITPGGAPPSLESLPTLMFGLKECSDMEKLQVCVVRELEKCSDPTPGNIADALFTFVKRVTPCENLLQGRVAARSSEDAPRSTASSISIFHSIIVLLIPVTLKYV